MKHLVKQDLIPLLNQGKSLEQLLPGREEQGVTVIEFVRIERSRKGDFVATHFEVSDDGSPDFLDVYEFSAIDPDEPFGKSSSFPDASSAIDYSCEKLGASTDRFVLGGLIQDEYRERHHSST
jgi:hypothetical protein